MEALSIGAVARQAGVNVETIRYYERRGLLAQPRKPRSGYREYPLESVRRVQFIKRAQKLGFTLSEIKELLALRAAPRAQCADVLRQAEAKTRGIEEKIRGLEAMRKALAKLMAECSGRGPASECPILESLEDEGS